MDDTFMSKVFEDKACAELLLKIILQKELTVKEVISQYTVKNLQGRSIRLDILRLTTLITNRLYFITFYDIPQRCYRLHFHFA